jgi:hypothetical protein
MLWTLLSIPLGVVVIAVVIAAVMLRRNKNDDKVSNMVYGADYAKFQRDDYHDSTQNVWDLHKSLGVNEVALSTPKVTRETKYKKGSRFNRHVGGFYSGLAGGISAGEQFCGDLALNPDMNCFRHFQNQGETDYYAICRKCHQN